MTPIANEVSEWLRKAYHDVRLAELGLGASPALTDGAAFHCQQAAEKLLKAWLTFRGQAFERIHDLEALVDQCCCVDPAWAPLRDVVEPLTA